MHCRGQDGRLRNDARHQVSASRGGVSARHQPHDLRRIEASEFVRRPHDLLSFLRRVLAARRVSKFLTWRDAGTKMALAPGCAQAAGGWRQ